MKTKKPSARSIRFEVDIWYQESDKSIHIASNDPDVPTLHTTVNDQPGSKRCHENLFGKLAVLLRRAGKPAPI